MSEGVVQNDNEKIGLGKEKSETETPANQEVEERLNRIAAQLFGENKGKSK